MESLKNYLQKLLPESRYGKDGLEAHHQVLKGINAKKFAAWINAEPQRLLPTLKEKQLTLLHTCSMLSGNELAKFILAQGKIDVNAQDKNGWTALHFASLHGNAKLINALIKHGARGNILNGRGASPIRLHDMVHPTPKKLSFFYEDRGRILEGDNDKFHQLTGKRLIDENVISKQDLIEDWIKDNIEHSPLPTSYIEKYRQFKQSPPPKLCIFYGGETLGWGVKTLEYIPKGTIFLEYLGKFSTPPPDKMDLPLEELIKKNSYVCESIDGKESSNFGPLINDGLPYIRSVEIPNQDGFESIIVFITLVDCPPGTELRWNYGQHFVKLMDHKEVSTELVIQTYKDLKHRFGPLDQLYADLNKKISSHGTELALTIDEQNCHQKIFYLFMARTALTTLILKKIISLQDVINCRKAARQFLEPDPQYYALLRLLRYLPLDSLSSQAIDSLVETARTAPYKTIMEALLRTMSPEDLEKYTYDLSDL